MSMTPITATNLKDRVTGVTPSEIQTSDVGEDINNSEGSENLSADELRERYDQLQSKFTEEQRKWELDMNRMKSSLQKQTSSTREEYDKKLEEFRKRLDEATTRNMTDAEKREYELNKIRQENESLKTKYEEVQRSRQEEAQIVQVRDAFITRYGRYGLSAEDIDMTDYESAVASGWEALNRLLEGKSDSAPTTEKRDDATSKKVVAEVKKTKVVDTAGKVGPSSADPMLMLRKEVAKTQGRRLEDISEELVFSLMNSGDLDVNEVLSRELP